MRAWKPLLPVLLAGAIVAAPATAASAATTSFAAWATVSVSGHTATATTTITSTNPVIAQSAGVCARDARNGDVDFPASTNVRLSRTGKTIVASQELATGSYTYFSCAHVNGTWRNVSPVKSVRVGAAMGQPAPTSPPVPAAPAPTPTVPAPAPTAPSGTVPAPAPLTGSSSSTMPQGNLPGWRQVFAEDFTAPAPLGTFPGANYSAKWTGYDGFLDTAKRGAYAPRKVLSAHDGVLDMYLHTENGTPQVAAPVPLVDGQWNGQTYGRYSVRFKSDPVAGYKTAWLLWPTSNNWNEGEIDFPEGPLNGTMSAFNHCPGNPSSNCFAASTGTTYANWHVATVEWTPAGVTYFMDGRTVGTSNVSPSKAMRWVLQTETDYGNTPANSAGHLLVDWAVMYSRTA